MNLANKLTILRIILVPIFVIVGYLAIPAELFGIPLAFVIMDIIFIIASITDKLDGYIARSRNQVTTFGKFLDPLADKILVLSALVMLVEFGKIPAWIPAVSDGDSGNRSRSGSGGRPAQGHVPGRPIPPAITRDAVVEQRRPQTSARKVAQANAAAEDTLPRPLFS